MMTAAYRLAVTISYYRHHFFVHSNRLYFPPFPPSLPRQGSHSIGQVLPCNSGDTGFAESFCNLGDDKKKPKSPDWDSDPTIPVPGSFFDATPMTLDNDYFKRLLKAYKVSRQGGLKQE